MPFSRGGSSASALTTIELIALSSTVFLSLPVFLLITSLRFERDGPPEPALPVGLECPPRRCRESTPLADSWVRRSGYSTPTPARDLRPLTRLGCGQNA